MQLRVSHWWVWWYHHSRFFRDVLILRIPAQYSKSLEYFLNCIFWNHQTIYPREPLAVGKAQTPLSDSIFQLLAPSSPCYFIEWAIYLQWAGIWLKAEKQKAHFIVQLCGGKAKGKKRKDLELVFNLLNTQMPSRIHGLDYMYFTPELVLLDKFIHSFKRMVLSFSIFHRPVT